MTPKDNDLFGNIIISILLALLFLGGIIAYRSIDWEVLKRMEAIPLQLPPASSSATLNATSSVTPGNSTNSTTKK